MTVGSEEFPFEAPEAPYIHAGQPHAAKFTGTGPEDRYKDAIKGQIMIDFEFNFIAVTTVEIAAGTPVPMGQVTLSITGTISEQP